MPERSLQLRGVLEVTRRSGDAATSRPQPFRVERVLGRGWRVLVGVGADARCEQALELSILTPVLGTPVGNLVGNGVVTRRGDTVVITA